MTSVRVLWIVGIIAAQRLLAQLRGTAPCGPLPLATGRVRRDGLASPIGAMAR